MSTEGEASDEQIRFLVHLQRLLDEGLFVASYKFALLLALADLAIEKGDDSGAPLTLSTEEIAEKFVQYYWRQVIPYPASEAKILLQNPGKQATIVNLIREARSTNGDSIAALMKMVPTWRRLVRGVAEFVRVMPLWKLQTVGAAGFSIRTPGPASRSIFAYSVQNRAESGQNALELKRCYAVRQLRNRRLTGLEQAKKRQVPVMGLISQPNFRLTASTATRALLLVLCFEAWRAVREVSRPASAQPAIAGRGRNDPPPYKKCRHRPVIGRVYWSILHPALISHANNTH